MAVLTLNHPIVANSITFTFFFAHRLSPLVSLLSPESEGLSDAPFFASLSSFRFTFPFYEFRSCIYVGTESNRHALASFVSILMFAAGSLGFKACVIRKL